MAEFCFGGVFFFFSFKRYSSQFSLKRSGHHEWVSSRYVKSKVNCRCAVKIPAEETGRGWKYHKKYVCAIRWPLCAGAGGTVWRIKVLRKLLIIECVYIKKKQNKTSLYMKRPVILFSRVIQNAKNVHPAQLASRGIPPSLHQSHQPARCDVFPCKVLIKNDVCFLWRLHQCSDGTCPLISLSKSPGRPPATSHFAVPRRAEKKRDKAPFKPVQLFCSPLSASGAPAHDSRNTWGKFLCVCGFFSPPQLLSNVWAFIDGISKMETNYEMGRRPSKKR